MTNKRIVQHRDDGKWKVRKPGADRGPAPSLPRRPKGSRAPASLANDDGGELQIRGRDGTIRAQDTISPGRHPRSSKG